MNEILDDDKDDKKPTKELTVGGFVMIIFGIVIFFVTLGKFILYLFQDFFALAS